MKKIILVIPALAVALIAAFVFVGCGVKLSEAESAAVGTYEMTYAYVNGRDVTKYYDYITFELKSNKKCTMKAKAGVNTTEQSASWRINGNGELEIITKSGFSTATETYSIDGDTISGTNTSPDGQGGMMTYTYHFQRVVDTDI